MTGPMSDETDDRRVLAVDELTNRFRARGLRVTPQRQVIFRLLSGNVEHPTVEALYEATGVATTL